VTDFGIAQAMSVEDQFAEEGSVMGTATYFSPEQAEGAPVDGRSDIYSLGVVLYEMLAGRPPVHRRLARGGLEPARARHGAAARRSSTARSPRDLAGDRDGGAREVARSPLPVGRGPALGPHAIQRRPAGARGQRDVAFFGARRDARRGGRARSRHPDGERTQAVVPMMTWWVRARRTGDRQDHRGLVEEAPVHHLVDQPRGDGDILQVSSTYTIRFATSATSALRRARGARQGHREASRR
jgi:hypothetical protein